MDKKEPRLMRNAELLEVYGHYTRMGFRLEHEQNYLAVLRQEMLQRMEDSEVIELEVGKNEKK